jgi:hypothetical protein
MGAPTRLAIVLGGSAIPVSELEPAERLELVTTVLTVARPQLGSFSGHTVREWANTSGAEPAGIYRVTEPERIELPWEVKLTTHLLRIGNLYYHDTDYDEGVSSERRITEDQLMLTRDGVILIWRAVYLVGETKGRKRLRQIANETHTALLSSFIPVDHAGLLALLTTNPELCYSIVDCICHRSQDSTRRRRKALEAAEGLERRLTEIRSHLSRT